MAFPTSGELSEVAEPHIARHGLDLEGIRVTKAGRKSVVAVLVDSDAHPGSDDLEALSDELSEAFDAAEATGSLSFGPGYTLEVSTPGVDLALTHTRHWRRNRGRLVELPGTPRRTARVGALSADGRRVALIAVQEEATPAAGRKGAARKRSESRRKDDEPTVTVMEVADISGAVVQIEFAAAPSAEMAAAQQPFDHVSVGSLSEEENSEEHK